MRELRVEDQTVYFASSTDLSPVAEESIDFFVTSPPYWNLKDYGGPAGSIGPGSYEDYLDRMNEVWSQCYRKAKEGAVLAVNANTRRHQKEFYPIPLDIYSHMEEWVLWDMLIWYVPNALPQPRSYIERVLDNKFEFVMLFLKGDADSYTFHKPRVPQKYIDADPRAHKKNARGRCLGNIVRIPAYRPPNVKQQNYHQAAYPEELVAFLLELYTDPGDVVLDPFLGSGTTLKVAKTMDREGIGFEINEDTADLIEERIREKWAVPDWKDIDLLHSSSPEPGMGGRQRKAQFREE